MTDTKTLTFTRSLSADPARVAEAVTSAEARMTWGTPDAEMVVLIEGQPDPAPGVREVSTCGPRDNPYVTVRTDWVEITPTRISYAETLEAEGDAFATSMAIFELTATGKGTDMAVTVFVASFVGAEALPEVESGWSHAVDGLTRYLS
ncbi:SRPBCC family protein [Gymnodinialimonas ceratoperidinii]|uniref:SRPBCC domain-containing protein n=1 Tax=Gymnodinialimonas ceratoperidinii TaxID=2856823 RepID=A0A8F6TX49_9RHOB|nr:SRPBCC domain-containing protein [Gymnodinialimonas ceratoperidinii]QXT39362.1 SRPBCC domain-containing protein [Gymnodinialimonas ceratoperidinii]